MRYFSDFKLKMTTPSKLHVHSKGLEELDDFNWIRHTTPKILLHNDIHF